MNNAKITYKLKINVGKLKDHDVVYFTASINDLENDGLIQLLLENDYIESWSNNNEFTILDREITLY